MSGNQAKFKPEVRAYLDRKVITVLRTAVQQPLLSCRSVMFIRFRMKTSIFCGIFRFRLKFPTLSRK